MFQKQGTTIGAITQTNANTISYNTTSDYRLKTDLKSYSGLDILKKIKTYDFAWKSDGTRMYGVMAHELQSVLPYAVSGKKDEMDSVGKILPQAVDYSKLTPVLVKAIQELEEQLQSFREKLENQKKELEILKKYRTKKRN